MDLITTILIGILIGLLINYLIRRRKTEVIWILIPKLTTIVKCSGCKYKKTRKFKEGDYVAMKSGNCPKCKKVLRIVKIFTLDKTIAEKKWEAYEKKFAV